MTTKLNATVAAFFATAIAGCGTDASIEDFDSSPLDVVETAQSLDSLSNQAIVSAIQPQLDLALRIAQRRQTGELPLVALAPKLVAGEGADPNNHTVIRILNDTGIAELSFLAYPPSVLGGVAVNAGTMFSRRVIVAAPLTSPVVRSIRIFNDAGILVSSVTPLSSFPAPFAIAVGNFLPASAGDELAIASRNWTSGATLVAFHSGTGTLLKALPSPARGSDSLTLSTLHSATNDLLAVSFKGQRIASIIDPVSEEAFDYRGSQGPAAWYESAFPQNLLVGTGAETNLSTLWRIDPSAANSSISASEREKNTWLANTDMSSDSGYVKVANLRHLRTDQASDGYYSTDFDNPSESHWVGSGFATFMTTQLALYATGASLWNPTFTQRHHVGSSAVWEAANDPSTGQKRFLALSRKNAPGVYTENDGQKYNIFTQADDPALNRLYYLPQKAFFRELAVKFRSAPDKMAALEATHEMESWVPQDASYGDYNPRMIANFRDYVGRLHGNLAQVNARFGTSFGTWSALDPPRNEGRGAWDAYVNDNAFFVAWAHFQRYAVNRRICEAMTESLLAGFPAELVRTHQIPQATVEGSRFVPMNWTLAAGAGSGQTRYGLFYQDGNNWLHQSFLSGRTMIDVGEYNPQTTNEESALFQLRYMRGAGAQVVAHIGSGDANWDRAANNSYRSFASNDGNTPRTATVGGIGAVRAVNGPQPNGTIKPYNIVSIGHSGWDGSGSPPPVTKPGILKSINEDGSWEGSVYAQPFHAHVDIQTVGAPATLNLATQQWDSGTIANLDVGDQIELSFRAQTSSANGKVTLLVLHDGVEMGGQRKVITVGSSWENVRWILRNQGPLGGVRVLLNSGERDTPTGFQQVINIIDFSINVHRERISHVDSNLADGVPHRGGVTFDVLSPSFVPRETLPANFVAGRSSFSPTLPGASFVNGGWNSMHAQTSIQNTSTRVTYILKQAATITHPGNASTRFMAPPGKKIYKASFYYTSNYDNARVVGGVSVPDSAHFWLSDRWGHNSGQVTINIPNTDWVAFGLFSRASFNVTAYPWLFEVSDVTLYYH